jgi:hypothetical protein
LSLLACLHSSVRITFIMFLFARGHCKSSNHGGYYVVRIGPLCANYISSHTRGSGAYTQTDLRRYTCDGICYKGRSYLSTQDCQVISQLLEISNKIVNLEFWNCYISDFSTLIHESIPGQKYTRNHQFLEFAASAGFPKKYHNTIQEKSGFLIDNRVQIVFFCSF